MNEPFTKSEDFTRQDRGYSTTRVDTDDLPSAEATIKKQAFITATRAEYAIQGEMLDALRATIETMKHRKQVNKTLKSKFEEMHNDFGMYYSPDYCGGVKIEIYDSRRRSDVNISMTTIGHTEKSFTWESLESECARWDSVKEYDATAIEQAILIPELEEIYRDMLALRDKAKKLVEDNTSTKTPIWELEKCFPMLSSLHTMY